MPILPVFRIVRETVPNDRIAPDIRIILKLSIPKLLEGLDKMLDILKNAIHSTHRFGRSPLSAQHFSGGGPPNPSDGFHDMHKV
ncbi:hypothetical protein AB1L42_18090 [Thalassoglobus sp. JC818]|uniref:hypothetical protein n=1 Tax=Thalassoglobus sp. JC818 TaxID=3232136 RepID=UPI00345B1396